MTTPDDHARADDRHPGPALATEASIDTSDIPETLPGTVFGPASDVLERARARARRGERGTDPGPNLREGENAVLLRLDGELARRMKASGPDWPERAEAALRGAFPG